MISFEELHKKVNEINNKYPRYDLTLIISDIYDLQSDFAEQYPNATEAGVYVLLDEKKEVIYIGKASLNQTLGLRLGSYFKRDKNDTGKGIARDTYYKDARFLVTIPLPIERTFEAPSIEEYLIKELKPKLNIIGKV